MSALNPVNTSSTSPGAGARAGATPANAANGTEGQILRGLDGLMARSRSHASLSTAADVTATQAIGHEYVEFGRAAIGNLTQRLDARSAQLAAGRANGTISEATAQREAQQIELWGKVRDRMALSVQRVSDILQGGDGARNGDGASAKQRREDEQVQLERRVWELQQQMTAQPPTTGARAVNATYDSA